MPFMTFEQDQTPDSSKCNPVKNTGAIIMDMQASLLDAISNGVELIESNFLQIQLLQILGVPICFSEQVPSKLGETVSKLKDFDHDLPIFEKNTFSAFGAESFSDWLDKNDIKHLIVSGIETPICIYQTCVDALRLNIKVTLLSDCTGGRRVHDIQNAISQLRGFGCCVVSLETVIYSIMKDSSHSGFREVSRLVRNR